MLNPQQILELQKQADDVFVHNLVAEYIVRLVLATRAPAEFNMPDLASVIQIGCSPRATLGLVAAARALALIHGRDYVLPTDVQAVAKDVMAHRLVLGFDAVADNIDPAQVIERIVAMVPPPTPVWNAPRAAAAARTVSRNRTSSSRANHRAGRINQPGQHQQPAVRPVQPGPYRSRASRTSPASPTTAEVR